MPIRRKEQSLLERKLLSSCMKDKRKPIDYTERQLEQHVTLLWSYLQLSKIPKITSSPVCMFHTVRRDFQFLRSCVVVTHLKPTFNLLEGKRMELAPHYTKRSGKIFPERIMPGKSWATQLRERGSQYNSKYFKKTPSNVLDPFRQPGRYYSELVLNYIQPGVLNSFWENHPEREKIGNCQILQKKMWAALTRSKKCKVIKSLVQCGAGTTLHRNRQ